MAERPPAAIGSDPTVGFIGAGRVAGVLAPALAAAGYRVAAVASRT
ncbi:MAG: DUF2520 domain-containing protein, partial [Chloroflexi bacterium]|nr:DUF2520 domain-containing protein [Chloroflexota bacterium]